MATPLTSVRNGGLVPGFDASGIIRKIKVLDLAQVVDLRVTHIQSCAGGPRGFRVVLLLSGAGCPS